jgi:hypothetical protein
MCSPAYLAARIMLKGTMAREKKLYNFRFLFAIKIGEREEGRPEGE